MLYNKLKLWRDDVLVLTFEIERFFGVVHHYHIYIRKNFDEYQEP